MDMLDGKAIAAHIIARSASELDAAPGASNFITAPDFRFWILDPYFF